MENNFNKIIIIVIICLFSWYILNKIDKKSKDIYTIDNKPYKVCGEEIYITNFTYNNALNISELLSEIETICESKNNY